jgi:hypothetical protein
MVSIAIGSLATGCTTEDAKTAPDGTEVGTSEATSALSGTDQLTQIAVTFQTGGDDKRSDSQVWFRVRINGFENQYLAGGTGSTWGNGTTTGWFFGTLPAGTRNQDITNFSVTWAAGGGSFIQTGDNWNLESLNIWVWDATLNGWQFKGAPGGNPLQRFTGSTTSWSWGGWPL